MRRIHRAVQALGLQLPHMNGRGRSIVTASIAALLTGIVPAHVLAAGQLTAARVSLSDPRPSTAAVDYTFAGSSVDGATAVRCVMVVISTTSAGDTAPAGFSGASASVAAGGSTLINSSATNWSLAKSDGTSSSGQNNIFKYTHSGAGVTPSTTTGATFVLSGITNPSTVDTNYFFKLNTFTNTDCATGPVDSALVEFIATNGSLFSMTVDQTLTFTVNAVAGSAACNGTTTTAASTSTSIPFGNVTPATNAVVCQDLTASTNASGGYTIYLRYTGAPSNGSATIADFAASNASPATFSAAGTESYGYTTDDSTLGTGTAARFTSGGQKWAAATTANEEIAYESVGVASATYRIGHQVGVSTTTSPGTYSTTVIYTCTPVY